MSFLIDCLCCASLVGIWPRFIEPRLLYLTSLKWQLSKHHAHLKGLKIVHISDLHFHAHTSSHFLNKILKKMRQIRPDLIVFTGDFLCYSQLENPSQLASFLEQLSAPLGSFCILGNHDYAQYVTLNEEGAYLPAAPPRLLSALKKGIRSLFSPSPPIHTPSIFQQLPIEHHSSLLDLLAATPFKLLENETVQLPIGLNVTGLGDLALGRCDPQRAFSSYRQDLPGIVLSHNPDSIPLLLPFPGEWILSGHTHGEQIHFPWPPFARRLSKRLTRIYHQEYTRGLKQIGNKSLHTNRGLSNHKPFFRLCSPPEILLIETHL